MPKIKQILEQSNINIIDAEIIIAHVLKKPREFVLAHPEMKIERLNDLKIKRLFKQRKQDIPLAYLTGHKEFYGLDFIVNKHTLIPRPETEQMVSLVLERLKTEDLRLKTLLIDVGTGSGCIPISIINQIRKSGLSGYLDIYAIDISANALTVAKKNARQHKVKIKFLHGNLLQPFIKTYKLKPKTYNLVITANLPYLTPQQFKSEPSIQHEPKLALVAGKDGLKYYEKLFKQIHKLFLIPYSLFLFIEIDPRQTKIIKQLIKKYLPKTKITIHKDLAGMDRVVEMKI